MDSIRLNRLNPRIRILTKVIILVGSDRRKRLECMFLGLLGSTVHQTTTARQNTCLSSPFCHYVDLRNQPILFHWYDVLFTICSSRGTESVVRHKRHNVCQPSVTSRSQVRGGRSVPRLRVATQQPSRLLMWWRPHFMINGEGWHSHGFA